MARLPRLTLPGHLHHVVQRGNNRQPIFIDSGDHAAMLALLADNAPRCAVALHAYVMLDSHFHLLATPSTAQALPLLMQAVGRRYVQYFNRRHGRTGTLWEGRYRSTVLQAERYLLPCMAYLDLSPVRAALAAQPADYPWSSHGHWAGARLDRFLTPHALYWALGNTPFAREAAYAGAVQEGVPPDLEAALHQSVRTGWALGDAGFVAQLQQQTPRRVVRGKAGRRPAAHEISNENGL